MRSNALLPVLAVVLSLIGSLAATLTLHQAAASALDREMDERLRGAGSSAALFFARVEPTEDDLAKLMTQNGLDGAYVVDRGLRFVADASGETGRKADLLRVDPARIREAFAGRPSVGLGYELGSLRVGSGYFPIEKNGEVTGVLGLEAGRSFVAAATTVRRARDLSVVLSVLAALALGIVAARWAKTERQARAAAERAARGEALTRIAASAAHEIRNPLGIIRGTVELMRERSGAQLSERDRGALTDILGEVERLRRLTEDLLDLSADRPLASTRISLGQTLEQACHALEQAHPSVSVKKTGTEDASADVMGDPSRLRQVFLNLLVNAAQAQPSGEIHVSLDREGAFLRVRVRDHGPGIPAEIQAKLFEPFVTGKAQGTGLGLAVSRRFVERHGGTLALVPHNGEGAMFEVALPIA